MQIQKGSLDTTGIGMSKSQFDFQRWFKIRELHHTIYLVSVKYN